MMKLGSSTRTTTLARGGRLGDPDPLRRAERLRDARLAIEHRGAFLYEVVDLDHGPVGCRRTWGGAEELAHQFADLRMAA